MSNFPKSDKKYNLGKPMALVPAVDWFAMYDDGENFQFVPVICWAPKEQDGEIVAVGLVADEGEPTLMHGDKLEHFIGFIHLSDIKKQLTEIEAAEAAEKNKTKKPRTNNVVRFPQRGTGGIN